MRTWLARRQPRKMRLIEKVALTAVNDGDGRDFGIIGQSRRHVPALVGAGTWGRSCRLVQFRGRLNGHAAHEPVGRVLGSAGGGEDAPLVVAQGLISEERSGGTECVITCRTWELS